MVRTVDEARQVAGDAVVFYDSQEQYETLTERSGMLREWKVAFCLIREELRTHLPPVVSDSAGLLPICQ